MVSNLQNMIEGWHPNPYIGREFHGVWGNYTVNITIDKSYVVGGTGYLQTLMKSATDMVKN